MAISAAPAIPRKARQRRFPFVEKSGDDHARVNAAVDETLNGIEDMLYKLARNRLRNAGDEDQVQEIVQKTMVWLWQKSMPKYDSTMGTKPSTFLYRCASNYINQEVRALLRSRVSTRHIASVDPDLFRQMTQANDTGLDARIDTLATDILTNPGKFLTEAQVEVFQAIINNPTTMMKDLAKQLGYQRASSLSMMMRRIRERITEISIEDYEPQQ